MVKNKRKYLIMAALLILLGHALYYASEVAFAFQVIQEGVVKVVPNAVPLNQTGTWFVINVTVENAPPVYAVQVQLEYDPTVLNASMVIQGSFLNASGVQTFVHTTQERHEEATPPYAIVTYAETLLGAPTNLPQGDGLLCRINFTIIGEGVSRLELLPYSMVDATEKGVYLMKPDMTRVKPVTLLSGFYGSVLVLKADKVSISHGENINLTCTLYPILLEEVQPPYTANITIQFKKGEEQWKNLNSTNVNVPDLNDVSISFVWQKPEAGDYKVKAIARIGDETFESNEITVKVKAAATPWWQSPIFIAAIILIIIVIVVVVLLRRRKGGKAEV